MKFGTVSILLVAQEAQTLFWLSIHLVRKLENILRNFPVSTGCLWCMSLRRKSNWNQFRAFHGHGAILGFFLRIFHRRCGFDITDVFSLVCYFYSNIKNIAHEMCGITQSTVNFHAFSLVDALPNNMDKEKREDLDWEEWCEQVCFTCSSSFYALVAFSYTNDGTPTILKTTIWC